MPSPDINSNWKEQHPDEGVLHEWLEEQLATDEAARVAAHVASCVECRERVAEAHGLIAASRRILSALDDVPSGVIPSMPATLSMSSSVGASLPRTDAPSTVAPQGDMKSAQAFRWRRWGAIAALLMLAVTGIVVVDQGSTKLVSPLVSNATMAAPSVNVADSSGAPIDARNAKTAAAAKAGAESAPPSRAMPSPPVAPIPERASTASRGAASTSTAVGNAVASTALPAAPQAAAVGAGTDTLSARLEAERQRRMTSEAVAADAGSRPRIDAIASPPTTGFAAKTTAQRATPDSGRPVLAMSGKVAGGVVATPFDSLVLTREPCFGRCPAYDLYVDGAGHVRYQSHHPDDTTREQRAQMAAADLERLRALLLQANVETLKSYVAGTPECGRDATDMPTLRLRVFLRGRWVRVEQYMGCSAGTPVLTNLARQIDALVGTQRWLPPGYRIN